MRQPHVRTTPHVPGVQPACLRRVTVHGLHRDRVGLHGLLPQVVAANGARTADATCCYVWRVVQAGWNLITTLLPKPQLDQFPIKLLVYPMELCNCSTISLKVPQRLVALNGSCQCPHDLPLLPTQPEGSQAPCEANGAYPHHSRVLSGPLERDVGDSGVVAGGSRSAGLLGLCSGRDSAILAGGKKDQGAGKKRPDPPRG